MAQHLIGRADKLKELTELLSSAAAGDPTAVMIDGDPGIGKTCLLAEFTQFAKDSGAMVLSGSCLDLEGGKIPYGPLIEALRLLVHERGEAKAREMAGPAWAQLARLVADFTEGESIAAGMGAQTRVFAAVFHLLDHLGSHRPLVLVFEDLQWADSATLDLVAYLALRKTDQRMMLVCSYRSGLPAGHPLRKRLAEPGFNNSIRRISLAPFTSRELRSFVAELTGEDVSPERADRYFELSEGNPYYTEQLVAEDDMTSTQPPLPESLSELMGMRIARLGPEASRVARVMAVAGRRVSANLLAKVVDLEEDSLDTALTECLAHQILVEHTSDDSYSFQHALLRATAYDTVRVRERKRLHAAMAEVLAEVVAENPHLLPELAHHWSVADRVAEALRAAVGAGDIAMRVRAFKEAKTQYQRALDLWPRLRSLDQIADIDRIQVLRAAADAARWAGHLRIAVAWAAQAVEAAGTDAEPRLLGQLYERLGSYYWESGADTESFEAFRVASRLLGTVSPSAVASRTHSALATAEVKRGHYTEALKLGHLALREAEAIGATAEIGRAKNSIGLALTMRGGHDEGIANVREALRVANEVQHLEDMLRAYANLGTCFEQAGQPAEAVEVFTQGLARIRQLGLEGGRLAALLTNNACVVLFLVGRWDEANALIEDVLRDYPARETTFYRLTKVELDLARGEMDEAERLLQSLRAQPSTQPKFLGPFYRCLAELAASREAPLEALAAVRRGIDAIGDTEDRLRVLQLCAFGLRVAADETRLDLDDHVSDLTERVAAAMDDKHAEHMALSALCAAENARRQGTDTPGEWTAVADHWHALGQPYPRAYALARKISAAAQTRDRARAAEAAAEAAEIAGRLGAKPLGNLIAHLVRTYRLTPRAKRDQLPSGLTAREIDVVRAVADGLTNSAIGRRLSIATSTVAQHRASATRKLGASTAQLVQKAREAGILDNE